MKRHGTAAGREVEAKTKLRVLIQALALSGICAVSLSTCDLWGVRDNPTDPGSPIYQGYPTVASSSDILPASPPDGGILRSELLTISKVGGAAVYELRLAGSEADLEDNPSFDKADYGTNVLDLGGAGLGDLRTYWWKARTRDEVGTWGSWSRSFRFVTDFDTPGAVPAMNPGAGIYSSAQSVTLSTSSPEATIRYTTDGRAPTASSPVYTGPIDLAGDGTSRTIKAIAGVGGAYSGIGSAAYTLDYSVWIDRASAGYKEWIAVASSSDGDRLVAAAYTSYIYTSDDGGATWTARTGAGAGTWYSVACSADGMKIIAGKSNGYLYTSADGGATWTEQTGPGVQSWYSVASSSDGTRLAAVDYGGYVWTSTDSGATWTERPAVGNRSWYSIASSADGMRLAAAVNSGYIWTSADGGNTWVCRAFAGDHSWTSICSSSDGTRLAAVDNDLGRVHVSADSGATWNATGYIGARYLACSADGRRLAVVRVGECIKTSRDFGQTWVTRPSPGSRSWRCIASNSDGTRLLAGVSSGHLWTGVLPP